MWTGVRLRYDKDVEIKGITMRRYIAEPTQFYTADCDVEERCNTDNTKYRMDKTPSYPRPRRNPISIVAASRDYPRRRVRGLWPRRRRDLHQRKTSAEFKRRRYVIPMATAQGGTPVVLALPALGGMEQKWLDVFEWPEGVQEEDYYTSNVAIEPFTGLVMDGSLRLQYTWSLSANMETSELWTNLFNHAVDGQIFWPLCWFHKHDTIDDAQAAAFVEAIYGSRVQAVVWSVIVGLAGLALVGWGLLGVGGVLSKNDAAKIKPAPAS